MDGLAGQVKLEMRGRYLVKALKINKGGMDCPQPSSIHTEEGDYAYVNTLGTVYNSVESI